MVLEPRVFGPSGREKRPDVSAASTTATQSDETSVGNLVSMLVALAMAAAIPFSLGWVGWDVLVWLTEHLSGGNLGGFRPDRVSSEVVGGIVLIVTAIGLAISYAVRHRNPAAPPSSQT